MKNKKTLWIILLVFVLLIGSAYILYDRLGRQVTPDQLAVQQTQSETESVQDSTQPRGTKAPDFTVYDKDGNQVQLSDYMGKPIVLNFWASWCGPCRSEMPDFQEKYLELGGEIHFLMINMTDGTRETVNSASEFLAQQGYTFPVFYDTKTDAAYTYGAYSLPTTYFIDAEGYVRAQAMGAIDAQTLQRGIGMIYTAQ